MQVIKFGGTSVGSAEAIKNTAKVITNIPSRSILVFSAFSGVTNLLTNINSFFIHGQRTKALQAIDELEALHLNVINDLFDNEYDKTEAVAIVNRHLSIIHEQIGDNSSPFNSKEILAQGELLSSQIIFRYFQVLKLDAALVQALDFMRINEHDEPDLPQIERLLNPVLENISSQYIVTQGYICRNTSKEIDNLKRGGSDYSAALIGAAIRAKTVQIWTDIDGLHNNDPRYVSGTRPIHKLSFEEAAELAYFGAKVLHPQSILPAKEYNIPVLLKNTFAPERPGTLIQKQDFVEGVRAIAAKDGITSIKVKSYRMLMSYGFLKKIFEVFEQYKTPIDVITTSEVAVSLTIDNTDCIDEIVASLERIGEVSIEDNLSVVCIVGYFPTQLVGQGCEIFTALRDIPIKMISYGGSLHNVSLIIDREDKIEALNSLHQHFFIPKGELLEV